MTSFEELKARALDLAQAGAAKAKELTDVAKLNIANSAEEDAIRRAYIDLGKLYYAERGMAPEPAYAALCEKITESKQKIEENKVKISEMKSAGSMDDEPLAQQDVTPQTDVPQEDAPVVEPLKEDDFKG